MADERKDAAGVDGGESPWETAAETTAESGTDSQAGEGADTVESIEPEPVPPIEEDLPPPSEDKKKSGGWLKPVFYLLLILVVVGGPVVLLAWNPVIQPRVNELTGLGLPEIHPFGEPVANPAIAALETRIAALETAPAPAVELPAGLAGRIDALEADVASLAAGLDEIGSALESVVNAPAPAPAIDGAAIDVIEQTVEDGLAGLQTDLNGLVGDLDSLRAEVRSLEAIPAGSSEGDALAGASSAQVAALAARMDGLDQRLRNMPDDPTVALERLQTRLAGLEEDVAAVASRPTASPDDVVRLADESKAAVIALQAALADAQDGLEGRISEVQNNLDNSLAEGASADREDQALVLAISQLASAVRDGRPFGPEAGSLSVLGAAIDPAVTAYAASGVATLPELRLSFPATARTVVRRALAGEEESVLGEALNRVAELVSVRRTGVVEGESADAIVARAEVALGEDDVAGAVDALAALPPELQEVAGAWTAQAEAKLAAEAEISRLQTLAAGRLGRAE